MNGRLSFRTVTLTLLIALGVSYLLCLAGDALLGWQMYRLWEMLLPGFTWPLTLGSFILGLVWVVAYSVYGALILVLPYNYLAHRQA